MTYTVHPAPDRPWAWRLTRLEQAEFAARKLAAQSPGSVVEIKWRGRTGRHGQDRRSRPGVAR